MLVGRQIVDRAKIQRIIFEFDYYEKAFHQFYDTYRAVPDAITNKQCLKLSEFGGTYRYMTLQSSSGKYVETYSTQNWTQNYACSRLFPSDTVAGSKKISGGTQDAMLCTIIKLVKSGLVDAKYRNYELTNYFGGCSHDRINGRQSGISGYNPVIYDVRSSFENDVFLHIAGFSLYSTYPFNDLTHGFANRFLSILGANIIGNRRHEAHNKNFANALNQHNVVIAYNQTTESKGLLAISGEGTTNNVARNGGNVKNAAGAFSSKMSSLLDSKIDDGRPGSGKLLAMKSGNARRPDASEDEIINSCYDQTFENVDKAIYNSDSNLKYGCNIIYVMNDLK